MYFTFTHAEYLWYLASIPVLIITHFAFLRYTKRRAIKFANFVALKRVNAQKIVTHNYTILVIRIIIIIALVFAIAGTTLWYKGESSNNDVIIAIDTSASMSAQDLMPTRLDAAKGEARTFVDHLSAGSAVGVISFSGAAFIEQLPIRDKLTVEQSINGITLMSTGGTDIPGAIITASNLLLNSKHGRTIIMLTDGSNTASYFTTDPIAQAIRYAKENSVIVYTVGLGTNSGPIGYLPEYYNISSVVDEKTLKRIANETGGIYYAAPTNDKLNAAYQSIGMHTQEAYIDVDLTIGLLIICIALIFLEWGLANTRFRSVP